MSGIIWFIHATQYVSLNILKIYPQIMLRNRIYFW